MRVRATLLIGLVLVLVGLVATSASAAPTPVACNANALINAIVAANGSVGPDTLSLSPGCTYVLTTGPPPPISQPLTILGNGATVMRNSTNEFRIFDIDTGITVKMSSLTVSGGRAPAGASGMVLPGEDGGGIRNNNGTLTLTHVKVIGNVAGAGSVGPGGFQGGAGGNGGGIANFGTLHLVSSRVASNAAGDGGDGAISGGPGGAGGGIYNNGTLTIKASTFRDNSAGDSGFSMGGMSGSGGSGGGLYNLMGTVSIATSTITTNHAGLASNPMAGAPGTGGGIYNNSTHISPSKTKIKNNTPDNCKPPGQVAHCSG